MIKKIYIEMPYIANRGLMFDLELENIKTGKELVDYFYTIFSGAEIKDKYNNVLNLRDYQDKKLLSNALKKDIFFNNIVSSLLTENERKLIEIILDW
jgi:hypothetical protein